MDGCLVISNQPFRIYVIVSGSRCKDLGTIIRLIANHFIFIDSFYRRLNELDIVVSSDQQNSEDPPKIDPGGM